MGIRSMNVRDRMKTLITVVFLPLLAFMIIYGATHNDGAQVGVGLAMIGVLGAFWGPPSAGRGDDA